MTEQAMPAGHAFISYVREDSDRVDELQRSLEAAGVLVWRDTADLWPGEDWRRNIRRAITENALVFVACFSQRSLARPRSYQNEELLLAIEQLRLRRPDDSWLIPVRFDDCEIPDLAVGGGRSLGSIQRVDLFADVYAEGVTRLIAAIKRRLEYDSSLTAAKAPPHPSPSSIPASGTGVAGSMPGQRAGGRNYRDRGSLERTKRRSAADVVIGGRYAIIAAIVGLVTLAILAALFTASPTHTASEIRASIDLPPGSVVPQCSTISGTVAGLPSERSLWLFIEIYKITHHQYVRSHIYYPSRRPLDSYKGAWSANVTLGNKDQSGVTYWLDLFSSDHSVQRLDSASSLTVFPSGFDIHPLFTLRVVRGKGNAVGEDNCTSYLKI